MKRILVPLDGSLLAEQAVPTAVSLSRRLEASLALIFVNESQPGGGLEGWPWAISSARTHGDYIASQARHVSEAAGRTVDYAVAEGRAADEICRHAAETHAELIVMASRGYTGFARLLGGSVADAVIRNARVPVLLLRGTVPGRRRRPPLSHMQRILIALDGSAESFAALDAATELAEAGFTELDLVEVVPPVSRLGRADAPAPEHVVNHAGSRLGAIAERLTARTGCDVYSHIVAHADPARGILRIAHGFNASLIAMGTHGRGASRLFMGSTAERVLGDGRYPMLIVHPSEAAIAVAAQEQQLWEEPWAHHPQP